MMKIFPGLFGDSAKPEKNFLQFVLFHSILLHVVGMWHSLVARIVRDDEAAGSNPVIPTIIWSMKRRSFENVFFLRKNKKAADRLALPQGTASLSAAIFQPLSEMLS